MLKYFTFLSLVLIASGIQPSLQASSNSETSPLSPSKFLIEVLKANPELRREKYRAQAEESLIWSSYTPENPIFGLMREKGFNGMSEPMDAFSITQNFKFPTKYFLEGSIQRSKARSAKATASNRALEVRQRALTAYYSLWSQHKILQLLQAQKETLKQIARLAEARYAAGSVSQQDEMKAHVEQTMIESEIIMAEQELDAKSAELLSILNRQVNSEIQIETLEYPSPEVTWPEIQKIENSNQAPSSQAVATAKLNWQASQSQKNLAYWNFLPDFSLSYKHAFKNGGDSNYSVGIELSVPLWFLTRQTPELLAASAMEREASEEFTQTSQEQRAQIKGLIARVRALSKMMQIFSTTLIPQASTSLNTSRSSYQTGRSSFTELLDSERSLYEIRIKYYRSFVDFVEAITKLESLNSMSLSTLPFGDLL